MTRQRTIRFCASITGTGLHTGRRARLAFRPAPPDSGIVFIRTDMRGAPKLRASALALKDSRRRTILRKGGMEIHTAEHLMAALSGLSIDNIAVEIDNLEVPGLDGSAKEFVSVLRAAGFEEQDAPRRFVEIARPIICADEGSGSSIQIVPDEKFMVEYFLDYGHPLLKEQWSDITLDGSDESQKFFENNIAPARTFCLKSEAMMLLRFGFGKGASLENTLVIGEDGPVGNTFRFPDEPARHKLLDLIGDLYVLGRRIKGRITAKKSGHRLNSIFIKRLQKESINGGDRSDSEDYAASISDALGRQDHI